MKKIEKKNILVLQRPQRMRRFAQEFICCLGWVPWHGTQPYDAQEFISCLGWVPCQGTHPRQDMNSCALYGTCIRLRCTTETSLSSRTDRTKCTVYIYSGGLLFCDGGSFSYFFFVYYEAINRELNRRHIKVSVWWKTKTKTEGATFLPYTRLLGGLEHLKIETSLIDERFVSVMGECVLLNLQKIGQFPDEPVRIKGSPVHYVNTQTYYQ